MNSKYPERDISQFYKYYSINTAKIVLSKKTLQYTPPLKFNDPFDIQTDLFFNFNHQDFLEKFFPRLVRVLRKEDPSSVRLPFYLPNLPDMDLNDIPENTKVKIIDIIQNTINMVEEDHSSHWKNMLPKIRVFCISEINDDILMWSHYSENHEGVCIELKVLSELDNHLCAAKKVIYTKEPPSIEEVFNKLTFDDWIDTFIGQSRKNDTIDSLRFVLFKSDKWFYEKEWRVWFPSTIEEPQKPYYQNLLSEELSAIYFGCKCKNENIVEIQNLAKKLNPEVSFYIGKKEKTKYRLTFEKM